MFQSQEPTLTSFSDWRTRSLLGESIREGPVGGRAWTIRSCAHAMTAWRNSHCSGLGSPRSPIRTLSAPVVRLPLYTGKAARPVPGQSAPGVFEASGRLGAFGALGEFGTLGESVAAAPSAGLGCSGTHTPLPSCSARAGASGPS
jgi:hypothetical protein